ncbi:hypothetical protein L2E82_19917 [Cichorium intybus]|uniref:Uncharacterized protein n=1 Tax=Cichorium intybus TaxID=13427 RepID=A0ACB9DRV8_CICIN|nr:hypothetical protein L2E82_19917 [Cichorium intybus]
MSGWILMIVKEEDFNEKGFKFKFNEENEDDREDEEIMGDFNEEGEYKRTYIHYTSQDKVVNESKANKVDEAMILGTNTWMDARESMMEKVSNNETGMQRDDFENNEKMVVFLACSY